MVYAKEKGFMEYVIISFRSRSDSVRFSNFLKANGVYSEIVNTPKQAGVGCGLSVKVSNSVLPFIKRAVSVFGESTFIGVFSVSIRAGKKIIRSI